jgi:alkylation response protein AidB-like acyl-CoA dehydrogenase
MSLRLSDTLLAIAEHREEEAMRAAERYALQHDVVASLEARLEAERALLRRYAAASEEAELAHREASRDLELEVDQEEDGAYGDDMSCDCSAAPTPHPECVAFDRLWA